MEEEAKPEEWEGEKQVKTRSPRTSGPGRAGWELGLRARGKGQEKGGEGEVLQRGEDAQPKGSEGNGRDWEAGWRHWGETEGLTEEAAG